MSANLSEPIRTAIVGTSAITSLLSTYKGSFPVFTRRPVPSDTPFPTIVVSPDVSTTDQDGVFDYRPLVMRDVFAYGRNDLPGQVRAVEQLGHLLRALFHRQRLALTVSGWSVTDIVVSGPADTPVEDQLVGVRVQLSVSLAAQRS